MNRLPAPFRVLLTACCLLLGSSAFAASAQTRSFGPQPSSATPSADRRPMTMASAVRAASPVPNGTFESSFVSIKTCRIADTRHAGGPRIAAGHQRIFLVVSDLGTQGGNASGCGIPRTATAIAVAITTTQETGTGICGPTAPAQPHPVRP